MFFVPRWNSSYVGIISSYLVRIY